MTMQVNNDTTNAFLQHVRNAAYLNHEGVAALTSNDPRSVSVAMKAFRRSLHILQTISHHAAAAGGQLQAGPPVESPQIRSCGIVPMPSGDSFYVYDQVKLFYPSSVESVARNQLPAFSMIVIFNTALAYHRRGMETKMTKYYTAAQKLYESGAHLFSTQRIAQIEDELLVMYIAILNNLALVQHELVQLDNLQETLGVLRQLFQHVMARDQVGNFSSFHQMEGIDCIQLNVITVNPLAPASAA